MIPRKIHLSYSSITSFKACPTRFFAKYICGLRRDGDTDSQRRGTNWHELLEVVDLAPEAVCRACAGQMYPDKECPVCCGTGFLSGDSVDAAIRVLGKAYADIPVGKTTEEIQTERAKLLYSLSGYKWCWGIGEAEPEYEVVATEVPFELNLLDPETGHPARDALIVGVIDKIVKFRDGRYGQVEHKSTAKPIGSDSMYWNHLQMDTQTTLYPYAMQRMQKEGKLEHLGIMPDDPISTTVYYDVWHTSQIKMKKISQSDTRKFIQTGQYCGNVFEVTGASLRKEGRKTLVDIEPEGAFVDGHPVTVDVGKAGDVSFIETEGMYGQRILEAIGNDPDKYFARREIQRTEDDMVRFEGQLYSIYQCMLAMRRTGHWYTCEHECDSKYRCDYVNYCWFGEDIRPDNVLTDFHNMFDKKEEENGNA